MAVAAVQATARLRVSRDFFMGFSGGENRRSGGSNAVHGVEQLLVLHADVQRKRLAGLCEDVEHFLPRFRALRGINQNNHGKEFAHQLLADIDNADAVFSQYFGYVVHNTNTIFANDGDNGMTHSFPH